MKKYIKITHTDFIEIDTDNIISIEEEQSSTYNRYKDEKWIKFCKEHNFDHIKDAYGKIYDLYLEFCINHLI